MSKTQNLKFKVQNHNLKLKIYINFGFLVLVFSFAFCTLSLLVGPLFAENIYITKIITNRTRGFDYLDIHTTGYIKAKGLLLDDQLIINLPNTKIAEDLDISVGKSKRIKNIFAKEGSHNNARVIVELKADIDYEIVNVFGRNKSVVEISDQLDYTARLMAAWERANLKRKGQVLKPYKYDPVLTSKDMSLRGKSIVLDPGHGGSDPGAFSLSGISEKRLTLQTARKIATLLSKAGATVYLTRNADRTCNIKDIVDFANKIKADIFLSIHYNFYHKKDVAGTETYYYNRRSRKLAMALHQSLVYGIKRKDRGLHRAMFYTIHHTNMPAVLIEPVFISNSKEDKLARSSVFQMKIARNILRGVVNYF